MSLTLTAADLARCEAASRALLSPLAAPSIDDWRREVSRALRELFHADRSLFAFPTDSGYLLAENITDETLAGYRYYLEEPLAKGAASPDPLVVTFTQRRRALAIEAYDHTIVDQVIDGHIRDCAFYQEVEVPGGLHHMLALHTLVPAGSDLADVTVAVYYDRHRQAPFGEGNLPLLRALLPAFRAGLDTITRFNAHRTALDGLAEALIVFTNDLRELHRNTALVRLLEADPARERLLLEIQRLAQQLYPLGFPRNGTQGKGAFTPAIHTVQTQKAHYTLRGTLLAPGSFGGEASIMIAVASESRPVLPTTDVLQARFGLTRREAEVALLLAEGLSNEQLAERLFISPHTARRHTENVLGKLELNSRKALALKLMQGV